jgi:hypothetical protein
MTQYLLAVYSVDGQENYTSPEEMEKAFAAVDAFNTELMTTGAFVFGGGLMPADIATTVRNKGGSTVVTDGTFSEAKEQIGGFWIVEAADLDAALVWAKKGSTACGQSVEVRPFQAMPED